MKTNQIIYFDTGFKKTVFNVVGLKEGEFVHLKTACGIKHLINKSRVLMIEIIPENMAKQTWGELADTYSANVEDWGEK